MVVPYFVLWSYEKRNNRIFSREQTFFFTIRYTENSRVRSLTHEFKNVLSNRTRRKHSNTGTVSIDEDENAIIANGKKIQIIYSPGPDKVDYTAYGINNAIVVDNTGIWRDQNGLSLHLKSKGVSKVLLTAPGKSVVNIVEGINDHLIRGQNIVSAASCSTNAAVPVLKVVHDTFGIVSGHIETIHSFTNDQNIIDNFHKKDRRGRAAPLNIILTSTGAGKAVAKVVR